LPLWFASHSAFRDRFSESEPMHRHTPGSPMHVRQLHASSAVQRSASMRTRSQTLTQDDMLITRNTITQGCRAHTFGRDGRENRQSCQTPRQRTATTIFSHDLTTPPHQTSGKPLYTADKSHKARTMQPATYPSVLCSAYPSNQ
jgi:hypothetical protein